MDIKKIYNDNEIITIDSYLGKCGIVDTIEYLNPSGKYIESYSNYNNMEFAIKEIEYWLKCENSKIFIIKDSDTDGDCSTLILYSYLKELKEDLNISILLHSSKQRGLDDNDIMDRIRNEKPDLVIVPDAGTNNREQSNELCDLGIGLIVLDHHNINNEKVIENGILISNQIGNVQHNGSGALVTHKFLQALDNYFNINLSSKYIDLVALSLVSDSMDMSEMENREYYHYGIETRNCINNEFLGKLFDEFIGDKEYSQRDISFKIIPKLNAISRHKNMEYKKRLIMAFLGLDNYDEVIEICKNAHKDQMDTINRVIDNNIDKINELSNNNILVFASDEVPRAYSGLLGGKIMNMFNKPTIVGSIKDGQIIGSLRSPIPLQEELNKHELVEWCEGHTFASGICMLEKNIQPLIDYYNSINLAYSPQIQVLNSYSIKSIPNKLFGLFDDLESIWTNNGIPKPIFHIHNIIFNPNDWSIIGNNKRTLKLYLDNEEIEIVIFNSLKADKENLGLGYYENDVFVNEPRNQKMVMECIGHLCNNIWNGKIKKQIIVDKYEVSCYNNIKRKEDIF